MIKKEWFNEETGKYKCPHCGKEYTKYGICTHIWRAHNEESKNKKFGRKKGSIPWNKGLTKENDIRVNKNTNSLKKHIKANGHNWQGKTHSSITKEKISNTMKNNPDAGGLRHGSGRGKKGWYKGYWCDSSWELAFVIYHLDHNIPFERNKKGFEYIFEDKVRKYYPDFIYDDGTYVEIKGYKTKQWEEKEKQFKEKLLLFTKKDLENILYYCELKYGNILNLYETGSVS